MDAGDEATSTSGALMCARCEYSLVGIDSQKSCPECGLAVSLSMHWAGPGPDPGEHSSRIASGLGWVLVANLLAIGAAAATVLPARFMPESTWPGLLLACLFVTETVNFFGFLRLATPQRGLGRQTPGYTAARSTLVLHGIVGVGLILIGLPMLVDRKGTLSLGLGCIALPLLGIASVLKMAFTFETIERIDWRYRGDNYVAQVILLIWLVSGMLAVIQPLAVLVSWFAYVAWVWFIRRSVLAYRESALAAAPLGEVNA